MRTVQAMTTLEIRPATASDADAVAELLGELGYPVAPKDIPARLAALEGTSSAVLLAIDANRRPVGLIGLHAYPVVHASGPVGYITALVARSDARGQGVGRALVREAERWARDRGCVRLTVTSAERRADAHAFYPACGMPYTGRRFGRSLVETEGGAGR
jgi:GNAT superfamily N-acetyltransferase